MPEELIILTLTAASIGVVHTLIGPDHYLPFLAMGRARNWSLGKTLAITAGCGVGHVLGSLLLGALGIALGWAVGDLVWLEGGRGTLAGWLLLGFGIAYTAWGVRQALRNRPHKHWHHHADGIVHSHRHTHHAAHAHPHESADPTRPSLTPWVLFAIFILGPCEPLIPLLMYPAASGSWTHVAVVGLVFGLCTLITMTAVVAVAYLGLSQLATGRLERYSHALAGLALVACGLAIQLGL